MDVPTSSSLGAMGPLLRKLDSLMATEDAFPGEVNNEIKLLTEDVKKINTSLVDLLDAEDPPLTAKCWMKEVRELSYDMDDYVDQIMHSGAGADAKTGTVGKSGLLKIFRLQKTKVKRRSQMAIKIAEFRARVQDARERRERYGLESIALKHRFVSYGHRLPTLHAEPADHLVDHGPMDELVKSLSSDKEKQLKVVSIVGHGGVGKTTLAKRLYQKLGGQFECRAFIRVSLNPDIRRLLTSTFLQIQRQQPCVHGDAQDLTNNIAKHLQNKRYFIIIDDLWAASMWDIISRAFPEGNCCSRIITTTQIEDVAFACCSYRSEHIFKLRAFDDDQSRKLFFSRIFGSEFNCPQEFKEVSYGIIQKCGGLPLAIINVASLLACEPKLVMEKWMHIQHSLCSSSRTNPFDLPGKKNKGPMESPEKETKPMESPEKETKYFRPIFSRKVNEILKVTGKQDDFRHKNTSQKSELLTRSLITNPTSEGIKEVLNLIYNNLPQHLKTCLLYLNMYPEDYTIHKDDLVKQWMAEGFLSAEEQDTEEVAGGYFDELIGRGMIQPVDTNYNDEVLSCTVHHMVLDFIAYKSMEENFITVLDSIQTIQGLPDKVRRLSIQFGSAKCAKIPAGFRISQVRSLTFFGLFTCIPSIVDYRLLRVLILHIWPDQDETSFDFSRICELFRLRYLKIACNMTVKLPTQMRGLLYLETLEVDARVAVVPSDIVHLQSLLNLRLPRENNLPDGIGHVTSLRRLGYFNLSNKYTDNVVNLGNLTNLRDLHLTCCTESSDRLQVNMQLLGSVLGKCINLKSLILDAGASSTTISCDGLSSVSPPLALLQRLELLPRICVFSNIPKWIGELGKLCILKIAVRKLSMKDIGILKGLPALTALSLYVHTVPVERIDFDKPGFSVLKYFKFRCSVPWLKFEADAMPNLRKLKLRFNALSTDQHGTAAISIEHLSGLREVSAKIGGAKADAESALTAISNHPSNPRINVQLVDWIFYGDEGRSMVKQEQEHWTLEQDVILEKDPHEYYGTQGEDSGEDKNNQADIRISTSESSSRLPILGAVGRGIYAVGWVVSPIITKLLNKGFSYLGFDGSEKLKELETKVLQLELTLEAVYESPHRDRLEPLLKNLKSAFYEAEDILDAVEYYRLQRQIVSQHDDKLESDAMPWEKKLQATLPQSSRPKKQASGTTSDDAPPDMSKMELKKILEKIENIINEAHKILQLLNLPSHSNVDKRHTVAANPRGAVTTAAPPPVVIGRDEDRDEIIAMLHGQPESNSALSYSIIGIHGIPGSGKSTLAQYVCAREKKDKQEEKEGHFDLVMWVHVSQNFSVHTILSEMIEQATGKQCTQFNSLTELQKKLMEELRGKQILLVLDDVWYNEDVSRQQELQQIVSPLEVGEAGSKILVTSRTSETLLALGAVRCIPISDLGDNVFLKLFMHYALEGASIDDQNRKIFEVIGADIAKKLKRSPLAARTVGGQLRIRPNVEFWRRVRDRDLLNETMGALWWSYHHLDKQVRRCFAYCSIFPRRYLLKRDELVNLWVAEGFIRTTNTGEEMEAVGHDYLDELVSTSFLLLVDGGQDCYTIHDLLRDLAEKVAGSDCFRIVNGWTGEVPRDVRYLFVTTCNRALLTEKILKLENLRTLIIGSGTMKEEIEDQDFETMFTRLRKLRVLSVEVRRQARQLSVPASIGQLKHIRYLAIKTGYFFKLILPRTFTKLCRMQVLDFGSCRELVFYPGQDMLSNLINLRHILTLLDLNLPNIIRLTSLQTLPILRVRKEPGYELRQLRDLNKLRGRLGIHGLENVGSKEEALEANLAGKERITELYLKWDHNLLQSCSADLEAEILEGLCPPMGLETLRIEGYKGSRYPDWMVGNKNGPKHLQRLVLYDCSRLGAIPDRNGFFLHLRVLRLSECSWDALPDNMEHLTSLKELRILACMNIRSLPTLPQSLEYLSIDLCNDVFTRSCKTTGDPNWQKIKHVPNKDIEGL